MRGWRCFVMQARFLPLSPNSNLVPRVLSLALGKSLETRLVSEVDRTLLRVNTSTFILLLLKGLQIETNPESKIKSVFMQCYPCAFWHWPKVCPLSAVTYTLLRKKIVINMSEKCKIQIYNLFLLFKRSKIWKFAGQNIMSLTANELVKYSAILIKQLMCDPKVQIYRHMQCSEA